MKISNIENLLENVKKISPELKGTFIEYADSRLGRRIALANPCLDSTGINVITDYLTYNEMYQYLMGYYHKSIKRHESI